MPALAEPITVATLAAVADAQAEPLRKVAVARLGSYHDNRYGDFKITAAMADGWSKNLAALFNGEVSIDLDHSPEMGKGTEAAGWIKGLSIEPPFVYGQVEWTTLGETAIREKRYRYVSPTFGDYKDEYGVVHHNVLKGMALTNRPVLRRDMPTLNLSREEIEFAHEIEAPPDSQRQMPELENIAKALSLATDADEATVLAKVTELTAANTDDTRTLAERAEAEDMVLLSKADHAKLKVADSSVKTLSDQVQALQQERADEKFTLAFDAALKEGRVDAKDETRTLHRAIYDAKPDEALTLLAGLPKIANVEAKGKGGAAETSDFFELERDEQNAKVLALAAEKDLDYATAWHQLTTEGAK